MNYDRIILELLDRVSQLEDEVKQLKNKLALEATVSKEMKYEDNLENCDKEYDVNDFKNPNISQTVRAVNYISSRLKKGIDDGEEYVDIVALQVEHAIGVKFRSPLVCNAMRKNYGFETQVIRDTESHNSTTYTMRYFLNKTRG